MIEMKKISFKDEGENQQKPLVLATEKQQRRENQKKLITN